MIKKHGQQNHAEFKVDEYLQDLALSENREQVNSRKEKESLSNSNIDNKILLQKDNQISSIEAHKASFKGILILIYYHCKEQGYCRVLDFQIFNEIYDYYISLNGNGLIKALKGKFEKIPLEEDYLEQKYKKEEKK